MSNTSALERASSALNALISEEEDNTKLALIRDLGARLKTLSDAVLNNIIRILSKEKVIWAELERIRDDNPIMRY